MKNCEERIRKIEASLANIALILSIFVVLFPLALPTVQAAGDTWYVGTGPGNDTASIKWAVEQLASDGDTVRVWSGTYVEYFGINNTITLESIEGRDVTIIDGNHLGTVITISASWVNVTGFKIKNGGGSNAHGIWLKSDHNEISECNITENSKHGLQLNGSYGAHCNTIVNNEIYDNGWDGMNLSKSDWNNMSGNHISNNERYGISFWVESNNNTVNESNIITDNEGGIYMRQFSGYNNIIENTISNNEFGIRIHPHWGLGYPCDENTISGNDILSNDLDGILLTHSRNNSIINNNISNNGLVPSGDSGFGIYLDQGCNNNNIKDNDLFINARGGIYLRYESNDNIIHGNEINSGDYGINLHYYFPGPFVTQPISDNHIEDNTIIDTDYGIYFGNAHNNNFYNNEIINPGFFGLYFNHTNPINYNNTITTNNTVNNEDVHFYYNMHGTESSLTKIESITLDESKISNVGKISLVWSSYFNLTNITIRYGYYGLFLYASHNIWVCNVTITNSTMVGVYIEKDYRLNFCPNVTINGEKFYYFYDEHYAPSNPRILENKTLTASNISNIGKINLIKCSYFLLRNNNVSNNDFAIFLYESEEVTLWDNSMPTPLKAGLFVEDGFHHFIPENNTVNNQTIYYFTDVHGTEGNPVINDTYSINHEKVSNVGLITYSNCSYLEIRNNSLQSNYGSGIFIVDSFNITVENNSANSNCDGTVLRSSENVTLINNSFTNNKQGYGEKSGLHLIYNLKYNYISNNTMDGNHYGIYVDYSHKDVIAHHNQSINNNDGRAIYLDRSSPHIHNNSITHAIVIEGVYSHPIIDGNEFTGLYNTGGAGIYRMSYCNRSAKIINNTFKGFGLAGIYLWKSSSPEIIGNTIRDIYYDGIDVYHEDSAPYIYDNIIYNTSLMGIQLEDSNATIKNNIIHDVSEGINVNYNPHADPDQIASTGSNPTIINNTIWNVNRAAVGTWNAGIHIAYYSTGIINYNTIYNCLNSSVSDTQGYGIIVHFYSSALEIIGNNCSNNRLGIKIVGPNPNLKINMNIAYNNTYEGISIQQASNTTIAEGNNVSNNYEGFSLYDSDCQITNNEMLFNSRGITIGSGSPTVSNNIIENNKNGTYIFGTATPIIRYNNISLSESYGIYINTSTNSTIYHNNIIDNIYQAHDNTNDSNFWDNGYPYGGNYWSDYNGTDNFHGPGQDIQGSDGIGDTPYVIDADSQDNYPLMNPWNMVHNIDKDLWYPTIQLGVYDADSGNTLEAYNGTFNENVNVNITVTIIGKYGPSKAIINGGGNQDVVNISADWVNITGFTVTDSGSNPTDSGIKLNGTQNCKIAHNIIINNSVGINLSLSNSNIISNNSNIENTKYGIYLSSSNINEIIDNNITGNNNGILLDSLSGSNIIYHNNFDNILDNATDNSFYNQWDNGLEGNWWKGFPDNPLVTDNDVNGICDQNYTGSGFTDRYPLYYEDNDRVNVDNTWFWFIQSGVNFAESGWTVYAESGLYLENVTIEKTLTLTGEDKNTTVIDAGGAESAILVMNASYVNINGVTVMGGTNGLYLNNSDNCVLEDNIAIGNAYGMYLAQSDDCTVSDNLVTINVRGIQLEDSNNSIIRNNEISISSSAGYVVEFSYNVTMEYNSIINNDAGGRLYNSSFLMQYNNISYNSYGIAKVEYSDGNICNNTITYNTDSGIINVYYSNAFINNNTISNNNYGIQCINNSLAIITYNNITSNTIGISCTTGSNATVHWNNLHNNTVWNLTNSDAAITINATENYWGADDSDEIEAGIDGNVDYDPYKEDPFEEAGPQ